MKQTSSDIPRSYGAILIGLIGLIYLPVLLGETWFLDVYLTEVYPHHVLVGEALSQLELPVWTRRLMMGYPLAYNPQVGAFYPFHMVFLPFIDAHVVLSWSVFLHSCVAAFGTYRLARLAGATPKGAVVAGAIYAICPFNVFYHQATHGLIVLAWMPWAIVCSWSYVLRTECKWLAYLGLIIALQMYAGHLQFVLYTLLLVGLTAMFCVPECTFRDRMRHLVKVISSSVVALALYAPQLFAAFTLWRQSLRKTMTAADISSAMSVEALGLDDVVESIMPQFYGGPSLNDFWYPEFLGIAVFLSVFMALRSKRAPRFIVWIGFGALGYLVAIQTPGIGDMLLSIPGLRVFRAPGRIVCWLLLFSSIFAGVGLGATQAMLASRIGRIIALAVFALGGALLLGGFDSVAPRDPELSAAVLNQIRGEDAWLLMLTGLGLLSVGVVHRLRPRTASWLLCACIIGPILHVSIRYSPTVQELQDPPFLSLLRGADPNRILGVATGDPNYVASVPGPESWPYTRRGDVVRSGWSLHANIGAAYGFSNLHGQTSLPLRRVVRRVLGSTSALGYPLVEHPTYSAELLSHLGVTHVVSRRMGQMPVEPRPPAIGEREGYAILQLRDPRPNARFYPESGIRRVSSESDAAGYLNRKSSGEGPIEWPLVVESDRPEASSRQRPEGMAEVRGGPSPVEVTSMTDGAIILDLDAPTNGVVLYTEAWFPEWTAYVDGEEVQPVVADGCFIGVPVSSGTHRITLKFEPTAIYWGVPFMLFGVLVIFGWLWRRSASPVIA